jgi:ABC-2 type transport system permease protein
MKKFLVIIKAFWQRSLTYRFTILAYRVGEVAEMLALILMWSAIYGSQKIVGGLSIQEMITYILVGNFFNAITRNFLSNVVARDIKNGSLSVFLIKPMSYFSYILSEEVGRISLVAIMSISASMLVIIFFFDIFIWNFDLMRVLLILIMVILAFVTELLLSYLVGLIAFWTDEVEGVYSTIDRIRKFFSGGYFPINLLPPFFVQASLALPFAYSFFVPAQLYLKKLSLIVGLKGLLVQLVWVCILYAVVKIVWKRGLRRYEGVGI